MKPSTWVVSTVVVASLALPAAAQVGSSKDIPARVELHAVKSLWLTDQQFLSGDRNGTEVTLGVELRVVQGKGKLPTMILMHGSGGIGANVPF
jgi:hypothetical protein